MVSGNLSNLFETDSCDGVNPQLKPLDDASRNFHELLFRSPRYFDTCDHNTIVRFFYVQSIICFIQFSQILQTASAKLGFQFVKQELHLGNSVRLKSDPARISTGQIPVLSTCPT